MKIMGMDAMGAIVVIAVYALIILVCYWVIKTAVKNGVVEAHRKLKEEEHKVPPAE